MPSWRAPRAAPRIWCRCARNQSRLTTWCTWSTWCRLSADSGAAQYRNGAWLCKLVPLWMIRTACIAYAGFEWPPLGALSHAATCLTTTAPCNHGSARSTDLGVPRPCVHSISSHLLQGAQLGWISTNHAMSAFRSLAGRGSTTCYVRPQKPSAGKMQRRPGTRARLWGSGVGMHCMRAAYESMVVVMSINKYQDCRDACEMRHDGSSKALGPGLDHNS